MVFSSALLTFSLNDENSVPEMPQAFSRTVGDVGVQQRTVHHGSSDLSSMSDALPPPNIAQQRLVTAAAAAVEQQRQNAGEMLLKQRAFAQLQLALDTIHDLDKLDYLRAVATAPHLVLNESDPLRFLRATKFDALAAAQRLVMYWKRRREVYGDRAYLPLTITGDGALLPDDVRFIQAGPYAILPNDSSGRPVMLLDLSRMITYDLPTRLRASFYMIHRISENAIVQTEGFVAIFIVRSFKRDDGAKVLHQLYKDTFPVTVHAMHVVNCLPHYPNMGIIQSFINGVARFCNYLFSHYRTFVHTSPSPHELAASLVSHGFIAANLPNFLGGSWNYEYHAQWVEDRLLLERELTPALQQGSVMHPAMALSSLARLDSSSSRNHMEETSESTQGSASSDDEDHRARKMKSSPSSSKPIVHDQGKAAQGEPEDMEILNRSRMEMLKILDNYPKKHATAYFTAKEQLAADVFKLESDVDMFLRVEGFDPDAAVKRMLEYWKLRAGTFDAKAFEPMDQTGEGTLGRKDLSTMVTGFANVLPVDSFGCSVLWIDGARLERNPLVDNRDRCLFYMFQILAENPKSHTVGAVLLLKMESPPFGRVDDSFLSRLGHSLPVRFKAIHIFSNRPLVTGVDAKLNFAEKVFIHIGPLVSNVKRLEQQHGLRKVGIPGCLGGEWEYGNFIQWQELRTRMELQIPLGRSAMEIEEYPAIKPYVELTDKTEVKRRMNIVHCRRKRDRVRVETDVLTEQVAELKKEQDELRIENQRLEELKRSADFMATIADQQQPKRRWNPFASYGSQFIP